MASVIVDLSLAVICFAGSCHNAVLGKTTEPGMYPLNQRIVVDPIYKGDVLQFAETDTHWFGIHRVVNGRDVNGWSAKQRRFVSAGCINVSDEVYDELVIYVKANKPKLIIR